MGRAMGAEEISKSAKEDTCSGWSGVAGTMCQQTTSWPRALTRPRPCVRRPGRLHCTGQGRACCNRASMQSGARQPWGTSLRAFLASWSTAAVALGRAPLSSGSQHHPASPGVCLHVRCPTCNFIRAPSHSTPSSGFNQQLPAVALRRTVQNLMSGLLYDSAEYSRQGKAADFAQHRPRTRGAGATKRMEALGAVGRHLAQVCDAHPSKH